MKKKIQVLVQDEEKKKPCPVKSITHAKNIFLGGKRQIVYIQMHIIDLIAIF